MHSYPLENKAMDQDFLSGKPVLGRAVIPSGKDARNLTPGDFILVVLSNGKKYKGKVIKFEYFMLKEHRVGEIEFIRTG